MVGFSWPCGCCETFFCSGNTKNDYSWHDSNFSATQDLKFGADAASHSWSASQNVSEGQDAAPCREVSVSLSHVTGTISKLYVIHLWDMTGFNAYELNKWHSNVASSMFTAALKKGASTAPEGVDDSGWVCYCNVVWVYDEEVYLLEAGAVQLNSSNPAWQIVGRTGLSKVQPYDPWSGYSSSFQSLFPDTAPTLSSTGGGGGSGFQRVDFDTDTITTALADRLDYQNPRPGELIQLGFYLRFEIASAKGSGEYTRTVYVDDFCVERLPKQITIPIAESNPGTEVQTLWHPTFELVGEVSY